MLEIVEPKDQKEKATRFIHKLNDQLIVGLLTFQEAKAELAKFISTDVTDKETAVCMRAKIERIQMTAEALRNEVQALTAGLM